jgi:hypothetical protein
MATLSETRWDKVLTMQPENDHDLLIRIDTKLEMLHTEIRDFESNSQSDRAKLWSEKASSQDLMFLARRVDNAAGSVITEDHERRIRLIERYVWIAIGAVAIMQIVLRFGLPH